MHDLPSSTSYRDRCEGVNICYLYKSKYLGILQDPIRNLKVGFPFFFSKKTLSVKSWKGFLYDSIYNFLQWFRNNLHNIIESGFLFHRRKNVNNKENITFSIIISLCIITTFVSFFFLIKCYVLKTCATFKSDLL